MQDAPKRGTDSGLLARPSRIEMGTVREGIRVPVRFTLLNTGKKTEAIREIRTFASCISAKPMKDTSVAPGDSIQLDYIFESLGYGGADVDKTIEILFGSRSVLKIQIAGRVLPLEPCQAPIGEMTYNFFMLVDLRDPTAYAREHILGAVNVPAPSLMSWVQRISSALTEDMIVYLLCENGEKSDAAASMLRKKGHTQFLSIVGGLSEWKNVNGRKWLVRENP